MTSTDGASPPLRLLRPLIFAVFLVSGAAGLMYEVVWFRLLTYVFGATLLAASTVLTSFMGGLALGSFALGRAADRFKKPLRAYALLELGIGASALLVPWLLHQTEAIARATFDDLPFFWLSLLRFASTLVVLLIPTTLMGATLPVMSCFLVRRRDALGLNVGGLYSANTLGAVIGTFITGFVLIASLGLAGTQYLAAGLNAAVALLALVVSFTVERGHDAAAERAPGDTDEVARESAKPVAKSKGDTKTDDADAVDTDEASRARKLLRTVLITYGLSGFVALSYQVVWTRGLLFSETGTTYTFTAMLTVFLSGLAIGGIIMTPIVDRVKHPVRLYAWLLLLLGVFGGLSGVLLFDFAPGWSPVHRDPTDTGHSHDFFITSANTFMRVIVVMGIPTLIMGMAFPVAAKISVPAIKEVGGDIGRLYAANTLGAILGAFLSGFVMISTLGMSLTILILALISLGSAAYVLMTDPKLGQTGRLAGLFPAVAAAVAMVIMLPGRARNLQEHLEEPLPFEVLKWVEGPMDTITVTEDPMGYRKIAVDNIPVAGTDRVMLTDQKSLAHLPALILPEPKQVLTVGFGSGGASYSYTLHDHLEHVHCVEISTTVPTREIQDLLEDSNGGLMRRMGELPQYKIIQDDARSYLRFTEERYDSIATDCTDLRYKSNANLYDLGYFQLCHDRLTEQGMVVVWMPLGGITQELFKVTLGTFIEVFGENVHVWYYNNDLVHYILLAGFKNKPVINYRKVVNRLADPDVQQDLALIDLGDPAKMVAGYVTGGKPLLESIGKTRLNTENHPILEFEAPRENVDDHAQWDNLDMLYSRRMSVLDLIDPTTITPEEAKHIRRMEAAAPLIAAGHRKVHLELDLEGAARDYVMAAEVAPKDPVLPYLLNFKLLSDLWAAQLSDKRMQPDATLAYRIARARMVVARASEPEAALAHYRAAHDILKTIISQMTPQQMVGLAQSSPAMFEMMQNMLADVVTTQRALGETENARIMARQALQMFPMSLELQRHVRELGPPPQQSPAPQP